MKKFLSIFLSFFMSIVVSSQTLDNPLYKDIDLHTKEEKVDLEALSNFKSIPRYTEVAKDYKDAFEKSKHNFYIIPIETYKGVKEAFVLKKIKRKSRFGVSFLYKLFLQNDYMEYTLVLTEEEKITYKSLGPNMEIQEHSLTTKLINSDYTLFVLGNYKKIDGNYHYPRNVLDYDYQNYLADYLEHHNISILNFKYSSDITDKKNGRVLDEYKEIYEVYYNPSTYLPIFKKEIIINSGEKEKGEIKIYDSKTGEAFIKENIWFLW